MGSDLRQKVGQFYLNADRGLAIETLLTAYADQLTMTDRLLIDLLATWDIFSIETESGNQVGAIVVRQGEAHIGIVKEHRAKWDMFRTIKALCDALYITHTTVAHSTPRVTKFLERYGWSNVGETSRGKNYTRRSKWD